MRSGKIGRMEAATTADQAVATEAEREALRAVRDASGETGGPIERHHELRPQLR